MSELKEQALLERVGELTTQYENKIADLRVELTNLYNELTAVSKHLVESQNEAANLRNKLVSNSTALGLPIDFAADETIEGEIVQEEDTDTSRA